MKGMLVAVTLFGMSLLVAGVLTSRLQGDMQLFGIFAVVLLLGDALVMLGVILNEVIELKKGLLGDESEETDDEPEAEPETT